jgi:DNA repair protein RadC
LRHGPENLSTEELLALCLVSGSQGEDAVRMSRRLLEEFGGIGTLLGASVSALTKFRGIGEAKAAQIKAMHELMARDVEADFAKGERFNDQHLVSRYLRKRIGHSPTEVFACLYLNSKHDCCRLRLCLMVL